MRVTLRDLVAAVQYGDAALVGESAGYLVLGTVDSMLGAPQSVSLDSVGLGADAVLEVDASASTEEDAETSARVLLADLLTLVRTPCPNLDRVARSNTSVGLRGLVAELERALVPVNRRAARRSLTRLYREAERSKVRAGSTLAVQPVPCAAPQAELAIEIDTMDFEEDPPAVEQRPLPEQQPAVELPAPAEERPGQCQSHPPRPILSSRPAPAEAGSRFLVAGNGQVEPAAPIRAEVADETPTVVRAAVEAVADETPTVVRAAVEAAADETPTVVRAAVEAVADETPTVVRAAVEPAHVLPVADHESRVVSATSQSHGPLFERVDSPFDESIESSTPTELYAAASPFAGEPISEADSRLSPAGDFALPDSAPAPVPEQPEQPEQPEPVDPRTQRLRLLRNALPLVTVTGAFSDRKRVDEPLISGDAEMAAPERGESVSELLDGWVEKERPSDELFRGLKDLSQVELSPVAPPVEPG